MKKLVQNIKTHVVLSLAAALQCVAIQAATFNFEADFSTALNSDSSIWSYRYQADGPGGNNLIRDGNYELLPNAGMDISGIPGFNGWQAPGTLPQVVKNTTAATVRDAGNMIVPPGQSVIHPADGQLVVVSWLAPASGTVRVDFRFTDLDTGCGDGVAWFVDKEDGSGNLAGGSIGNGGDSGMQTISTLSLMAGEHLNFIVDPNGNFWCDSTRLFAEIAYLGTDADFSLERDFSLAQNSETSLWSYRFQSNGVPTNLVRDGNYELLPDQKMNMDGYSGINGWAYQANPTWPPGGLPEVGKNTSGAEIVSRTDPFRIPAGQVYAHPAPNQIVVVSWLAPRRGTIRVDFRFSDLNEGWDGSSDNGVAWFVDKGDASRNLAAGGFGPGGESGPQTIPLVNVLAGDRINFIVDPAGRIDFDATRVFAEINYLNDFDLERDFSPTENTESSVWSYRYQADGSPDNRARDGSYELLPDLVADLGGPGLNGWALIANPAWGPGFLPEVTKNTGVDMAGGVPAGQCNVHPAPNELVVASWLAPSNGTVRLEFQFTDLNGACGDGVIWYVDHGSASGALASGDIPNGGDGGMQVIPSVTVATGDRINFIVDPRQEGTYNIYCDLTRVYAHIIYLPSAPYTDFDLERDFSGLVNTDTITWSYRYQANGSPDNLARDGSYELLPYSTGSLDNVPNMTGWYSPNQYGWPLPLVGKNFGETNATDGHTMSLPPGQIRLHPNFDQIPVVSWLAPSNGTVRLDFRFTDVDPGNGNGILWFVDKGDASGNLASGSFGNGGDSGPQAIPRLQVAAGDRIHFIVDPNADIGWDSTRLMVRFAYMTDTDFDFERDFSTVQNTETNTWSYRYQANGSPDNLARDGNYELLQIQTTGSGTMAGMSGWYYPSDVFVGRNLGDATAWDGYTQYTAPGVSTLHPNPSQIVVVSWLAPFSGSVRVECRFTDLNAGGGDGIAWYVDKGDASGNLAGGAVANSGGTALQVLPSVRVAAGDRLNFVVDPKLSNHGWDATRLLARITYNPPASGPRLTATIVEDQDGRKMRLSFDTQPGFKYTVEYTDVLPATGAGWSELFGSPLDGTGVPLWLDDVAPWDISSQRFYRLRVE